MHPIGLSAPVPEVYKQLGPTIQMKAYNYSLQLNIYSAVNKIKFCTKVRYVTFIVIGL